MSAFLFIKRRFAALFAVCVCSLFIFAACIYAGLLFHREEITVEKTFYFLIAETEHIQVGTEIAQLNGGAGYPLQVGENYKVAYAVYFNREQGEKAQTELAQNGTNAQLRACFVQALVFTSVNERKNISTVCVALDNLYACMQILQQEIQRLSRGATQQSSKRILETLKTQLCGLLKSYRGIYDAFAQVCSQSVALLENCLNGVVYNKDLRYLLCFWGDSYVRLCSEYAI